MNYLQKHVLRLADNALILGQRLSEWCGHGPFLEEDIAITNTALDYVGRARVLYSYAAEIDEEVTRSEDYYAYNRDEEEFENFQICELPVGDYAFTMVRQFLVDCYFNSLYGSLSHSENKKLASIASKVVKESAFHLRRSRNWICRFGKGTNESRQRVERALNELWGYTDELFEYDEVDLKMVEYRCCPSESSLRKSWGRLVFEGLEAAQLEKPTARWSASGGRKGVHTEHMGRLLAELQVLQRRYPSLSW